MAVWYGCQGKDFRLLKAAKSNDFEVASGCLKDGADPNYYYFGLERLKDLKLMGVGCIPLHVAAKYNSTDIARLLLQHRAHVNFVDDSRNTPLHVAAQNGSVDVARLLIEHEGDLGALNYDGSTPFYIAVEFKQIDVARLLIARGANVDSCGPNMTRPLHVAANNAAMAEVLLEAGASPNFTDNDGETPLHRACYFNDFESARSMLRCSRFTAVAVKNKYGKTAIGAAQWGHRTELFDLLKAAESRGASSVGSMRRVQDHNETNSTEAAQQSSIDDQAGTSQDRQQQLRTDTSEDSSQTCKRQKLEAVEGTSQGTNGEENLSQLPFERYNTCPKNPGCLLMILNRSFDDGRVRRGSEKDSNAILEAFRGFNYGIQYYEHCTGQTMKNRLEDLAIEQEFANYSCFVIAIMSHGGERGILGIDGTYVTESDIIRILGSSKTLAGKPKLVLLQACRGGRWSSRVGIQGEKLSPDGSSSSSSDEDEADHLEVTRTGSDIIVVQSTIAGHGALRCRRNGSYFIQCFARLAQKYGRTQDVDTMIKMVVAEVEKETTHKDNSSVPTISHGTLKKHFYLV